MCQWLDQCGQGPCEEFDACIMSAGDACTATKKCVFTTECTSCYSGAATCESHSCSKECGIPDITAGFGDGGILEMHTCADLKACCDEISTDAAKMSCTSLYDNFKGMDQSCSVYYATFKSLCT
jgi:hypothetical protein